MRSLICVGFWRNGADNYLPDPREFIDPNWDNDERELVAAYLRHGTTAKAYLGNSTCRICGRANGSTELTDGVFVWPEGLAHYLENHQVRLPQRLVDHIRARQVSLEDSAYEIEWWVSQQPTD